MAVLQGTALGVIEIIPDKKFYDYEAKYNNKSTTYVIPAQIPKKTYENAIMYSEKIFKTLGCRGIIRIDFRYDKSQISDGLYMLEVNTNPGLTFTSIVPKIAKFADIEYDKLIEILVNDADLDHRPDVNI